MWGILQTAHPWRGGLEAFLDDRMRWPGQSSSSAGQWSEWTSDEPAKRRLLEAGLVLPAQTRMSIYSDMMGFS
jgi:hypothetical protein